VFDFKYIAVALITLGLTIFYNMFFKGFLGLIPILLGIVSGCLVALAFGIIDLTPIKEAAWFALPNFEVPFVQYEPKLYLNAITTMAPIAFVTMTEHIG
ncbi:uracil permease, partial [Cronobacter sakazakii]|uniref:solute carrier family 23 protein n=1 Tax=Cronobacter sakazakii TaxID=28141 RepID=UPI000FF472D8